METVTGHCGNGPMPDRRCHACTASDLDNNVRWRSGAMGTEARLQARQARVVPERADRRTLNLRL
eukprot:10147292-Alexandrium_andersonii.AAC.1